MVFIDYWPWEKEYDVENVRVCVLGEDAGEPGAEEQDRLHQDHPTGLTQGPGEICVH